MTIDEIIQSMTDGTQHDHFLKEREKNRKLEQKARTKNAIINILAVLCFPIALFVLVIAELIHTTE